MSTQELKRDLALHLFQQGKLSFGMARELAEMGREARREYEHKYTAERNYERLMEIYGRVVGDKQRA